MTILITRLRDTRLLRYILASACALLADFAAFLALLETGLMSALASAAGYSWGIVVHWLISSRFVFGANVAQAGVERMQQKSLFVGSALLGLALTTGIVWAGSWLGFDPRLAKCVAAGTSFIVIWVLRSQVVFGNGRYALGN